MKRNLKTFVVPRNKPQGTPPAPGWEEEIEASTMDGLLDVARRKLESSGYAVRALSFTPDGLLAYVVEAS